MHHGVRQWTIDWALDEVAEGEQHVEHAGGVVGFHEGLWLNAPMRAPRSCYRPCWRLSHAI